MRHGHNFFLFSLPSAQTVQRNPPYRVREPCTRFSTAASNVSTDSRRAVNSNVPVWRRSERAYG